MNTVLGLLTIILATIGYIPYVFSVFKGQTKPHIFSWFIWGILTTIAFFVQWSEGGGAGSWVTGYIALWSFFIAALALKYGEHNITKSDKISFVSALLALPLWYITQNPLYTIIIVIMIDALGFYPTFRKTYKKPNEEQPLIYILSALNFFIALFALDIFNLTTTLYPLFLVVANSLFVAMLYWRKHIYASR